MRKVAQVAVAILAVAFVVALIWMSFTVTGEETMSCEILEEARRHTSRRSFGYSILTSCGKMNVHAHVAPFLEVGQTYLLEVQHKLLGGSVIVGYSR